MNILSFDIGGTGIYYALFKEGKSTLNNHIDIRGKEKDYVVKLMASKFLEIKKNNNVSAIGIASPGAIIDKGYVKGLTGIKNYTNFNLKNELQKKGIDVPIFIINDANAAGIAEFKTLNKKHDINNLISISIGTGIGGAIIIDNKLFTGREGLAGEFGYLIQLTKKDSDMNASQLSSALSIERRYQEITGNKLTTKEIFGLYNKDDKSKQAIDEMVESLSRLIFNIVFSFNIQDIVLSGAITQNSKFIKLIKDRSKQIIKSFGTEVNLKIRVAKFAQEASLQGAYQYAEMELNNEK